MESKSQGSLVSKRKVRFAIFETKSLTSSGGMPGSTSSAGADTSAERSQQCLTPSVASIRDTTLPETAPVLNPTSSGMKIPRNFWECIYSIMRECCQEGEDEWITTQQVQMEYQRRNKKPLSGEYLKKTCGVKSLKQFFADNPWIDLKVTPDDALSVKLRHPSSRVKKVRDMRPRHYPPSKKSSTASASVSAASKAEKKAEEQMALYEEEEEEIYLPKQSSLPTGVFISEDLRERVYRLLWFYYPQGVDICTFSQSYIKRYGIAFTPFYQCLGVPSVDFFFRCIGDIVRSEIRSQGVLWLEPIDYDVLHPTQEKAAPEEVPAAATPAQTARKPPPVSVLDELLTPLALDMK